jgi:hypothetical protein
MLRISDYPCAAFTGTTRIFRLREVVPSDETDSRRAQTFNIPLPHNSVRIMLVINGELD